jgi:hypothetical protein
MRPPATTPDAREKQLIAATYDLAERQILEGKASSQIMTHFLKMGAVREDLERERLKAENALLQAKVESMASQDRIEKLYSEALEAMQTYRPAPPPDEILDD